jgi:hypothetical protein
MAVPAAAAHQLRTLLLRNASPVLALTWLADEDRETNSYVSVAHDGKRPGLQEHACVGAELAGVWWRECCIA